MFLFCLREELILLSNGSVAPFISLKIILAHSTRISRGSLKLNPNFSSNSSTSFNRSSIESSCLGAEDFFVLDVELTKINGLLRVLVRKLEEFSDKNIEFSKLNKKIQNYFENHYFVGELEKIKEVYSEDPLRVKHIRNSIIHSLQDDKMIFRIYDIAKDLK